MEFPLMCGPVAWTSVNCNRKIGPVPFRFEWDHISKIEDRIFDFALLVSSKLAHETDDSGIWNRYARACIQEGMYNGTKRLTVTFQCDHNSEEKTRPIECVCWGLQLPNTEEVLISIVPKNETNLIISKEIDRMLKWLNFRRGYAVEVGREPPFVHIDLVENEDVPVEQKVESPTLPISQIVHRPEPTDEVSSPKKQKFTTPNSNFKRHPANPYTPDRKPPRKGDEGDDGPANDKPRTPDRK